VKTTFGKSTNLQGRLKEYVEDSGFLRAYSLVLKKENLNTAGNGMIQNE
jgi:hypothetical protein